MNKIVQEKLTKILLIEDNLSDRLLLEELLNAALNGLGCSKKDC